MFRIVIATLVLSAPSAAQVLYGSLVGTVQDSGGAVVPGAAISVKNVDTGQALSATTTDAGTYTFGNLLPGNYELSVSAKGFRGIVRKDVAVTVNVVRREDFTVEVGQVNESVTVQASAAALQTDKADVHVELGAKEVTNMPLPRYRNYQSLINLVPGATPGRYQNSIQAAPSRALETNVNGVNRNNNATRIDGALSLFLWLPSHTAYVPPAETIETVNVATNNFDAEQGLAGGAAITLITKSGTNTIHGSAFAFNDNRPLRARNFFAAAKPANNQNVDGFTLGGPIVKNKLFYFGGWEGNRERLGISNIYTVATEDQRRGDFSRYLPGAPIYDPASGNLDGSGRTAFPGNVVPLSRQSAIIRRLQDLIPVNNAPGVVGNFRASGTQRVDRDNFDAKINWNRRDTHSIWGKYSIANATVACEAAFGAGGGAPLCQGNIGVGDLRTQVATIGQTKTFTPTFLWDFVLGYTRQGQGVTGMNYGQNFGREVLGIPGTNGTDVRESGAPTFSISGYTNHASDTDTRPFFMNDDTFTMQQNFSYNRARHDVRFGFEGVRHHLNHYSPDGGGGGGPQGAFIFNPGIAATTGYAGNQYTTYASYLMGLPQEMRRSAQFEKMTAFNYQLAWYLRDRWQVSQKLTVSLGVRYELFPMQTRSGRGGIEDYDEATNLVSLGGVGDLPRTLNKKTSHKLFAPRVGIAYRMNQSTVIRTGYGITYNPMSMARPLRGFFPLVVSSRFQSVNGFQPFRPVEQGIPAINAPNTTQPRLPLPSTALIRYISGDTLNRGYTQSWNFIIERQLPGEFLVSAGYVGTSTVRAFADLDVNAAAPGAGTNGRPLARRFGRTVETWAWNGFLGANYHSLQLSMNKRAAEGLVIKGAYTLSKAINYTDDDGWAGITFNYLPHFERNRAKAGYDIPHILQMGFVYELPAGKGKKYANSGAAKWVLGGWQVNGVFGSFVGRPFTISSNGASLNAPGSGQTADQVKTTVEKLGNVGPGQLFYDRTAFAPVTEVRFGTSGRNILRGPGVVNLDLGVFRKFPITERFTLEFRAEGHNATNTPHFDAPSGNANAANFMQVTSAQQDQRQIRLGLRLAW